MPWNSTFPVGSISVKANRTVGQQNTTYIETTMGTTAVGTQNASTRDHFWNVGSNEDGRHRYIQSPRFTIAGVSANPTIGTGMDSVLYTRRVNATDSSVQGFFRNTQGVYQYIPAVLFGTHTTTNSFTNIGLTAIPAGSYGNIFMYRDTASRRFIQTGSFYTNATDAYCFSNREVIRGTANDYFLEFANGSDASGLFIRVKRGNYGSDADGTWNYIIKYRAL